MFRRRAARPSPSGLLHRCGGASRRKLLRGAFPTAAPSSRGDGSLPSKMVRHLRSAQWAAVNSSTMLLITSHAGELAAGRLHTGHHRPAAGLGVGRAHLPSWECWRAPSERASRDCCPCDKDVAQGLPPPDEVLLAAIGGPTVSALATLASYWTSAAGARGPDCPRSSDGAPCAGLSRVNEGAGLPKASDAPLVRSKAADRAPVPHGAAPARRRRIHWRSGCRAGSRHRRPARAQSSLRCITVPLRVISRAWGCQPLHTCAVSEIKLPKLLVWYAVCTSSERLRTPLSIEIPLSPAQVQKPSKHCSVCGSVDVSALA